MADWPLTAPDGAYELGGGDFSFGQNMTESIARSLFEIPDFNALNALTVLPELLLRLPLEALQRFQAFIPDVLDGAFNTVTGAVDAIMGALTNAPRILSAIIQQLNAVLSDIFGGLDLGDLPTPEEFWNWIVTQMIEPLDLLLGPNSPLNVLNLVGQLPQSLFGLIPASAISGSNPNLLTNPGFDGSAALAGAGIWAWDSTTGRNTPGSAKTTANGTMRAILSNPADVEAGQVLAPSVWVKTAAYSGSGTPIRLDVRTYNAAGTVVGTSTIAAIAGPGAMWTQLSGSYTVPAGVSQVRLRLVVDSTATGGDVWFDDATLAKTGNGPFDGILELFGLGNLSQLFGLDVDSVWSSVITAILNPLSLLEDSGIRATVEDLIDQLLGAIGLDPLGSIVDKILDLTDGIGDWLLDTEGTSANLDNLIGDLLSDPASVIGSIPQALVSGLTGALGNIQTTLNQIGDVFNGLVVTPINSIVGAVSSWFNSWFGGGSSQAIPVSQKGVASGVAPLNSSAKLETSFLQTNVANGVPKLTSSGKLDLAYVQTNGTGDLLQLDGNGLVPVAKLPNLTGTYLSSSEKGASNGVAPLNTNSVVPLINLPAEVGGSGGSGDGRPYVVIYSGTYQDIPNNTETVLTNLSQYGTASVTFENSSNTRFRFNTPGMWFVTGQIAYPSTAGGTGIREGSLRRVSTFMGSPFTIKIVTVQFPGVAGRLQASTFSAMVRVADYNPIPEFSLSEDDLFDLTTFQNSGATTPKLSSDGMSNTMLTCVYLGA
ncbi:hypothetical protein [Mycolicibacterium houstonense]|uniref:hypothetical protein n=1 Tax=Mycolicibacterium houstonense TaxID=146021 RepID=UPI00082C0B8F|nr:hypothetical protein [Mycolicibacterium houstonense]